MALGFPLVYVLRVLAIAIIAKSLFIYLNCAYNKVEIYLKV